MRRSIFVTHGGPEGISLIFGISFRGSVVLGNRGEMYHVVLLLSSLLN
jgi:hypothetical protein